MSDAMKTLRSRLCGQWFEAARDFQTLWNPSTEAPLARASSTGADLPGALSWARERGGPALRALNFAHRGEILKALGKRFREHREELLPRGHLLGPRPFGRGGGGSVLRAPGEDGEREDGT